MPQDSKTVYEKSAQFAESLFRDWNSAEIPQTLRQDLQETYDFYLDRDSRDRLKDMHPVKRWFVSSWLLIKNVFLKLTPTRRIVMAVAIFLAVDGLGGDTSNLFMAFLATLFVLGLELKDKLLARNELEAGRAVQSALMPEQTPRFPGWDIWLYTAPANEVGGDLIDCQRVDKGRFSVSLGDVSGKGLAAALFMAKLQATVRAIAPSIHSLAELGARVNEIFCRDGLPGRFASLVYAELSDNDGTVRVVNAGHMPPHLVTPDGIEELDKGGPAIGLMAKARYVETETRMAAGDVLVIVSDGVTEARNEVGAFFGDDRLHRLLAHASGRSARDVGEHILDAVNTFVGSARPSDDLSVAVVVRNEVPRLPQHQEEA
ncbi:MAG: serine/threonine-protein phosphatase [Rhodothermales bacterium]|nr:serine/threonine-protein phosphatase [Rhodothermales bacterium]